MVSVPGTPTASKPATPLAPSRSVKARTYAFDPLPPLSVRLIDGSPAAAVVTITKGKTTCRYLVAVVGYFPAWGVITRWQKPDGTIYNLSYCGFDGSCDCPGCCYESTARADRRHGTPSGSYGCCKLDTLAELVNRRLLDLPGLPALAPAGLSDEQAMDRRDAGLPPVTAQQPGPTDDLPF